VPPRTSARTVGTYPNGAFELAPFRFGLVGAGRMGQTHLRAFEGSDRVQVVAIAEPDERARQDIAQLYGLRGFGDLSDMLGVGEIDGVLVATPTDTHLAVLTALSATGIPALCEKPCGTSPEEARRVVTLMAASGSVVHVAYWRRFVPSLQRLRQRIRDGKLGSVLSIVCSQWDREPPSWGFRERSGGIFVDMGVHEIDQVRWLMGDDLRPVAVASAGNQTSLDPDGAALVAETTAGVTVLVSLGRYYPGGDMVRIEAFGTEDHVFDEFLTPADGEDVQLRALESQAAAFADHVRGGPCVGATVQDAVAALDIAAWAQRKLAIGTGGGVAPEQFDG
jgi:myo-inositol 2-dehydrogenase/D-chiro-inositol 1-dehydrogenase